MQLTAWHQATVGRHRSGVEGGHGAAVDLALLKKDLALPKKLGLLCSVVFLMEYKKEVRDEEQQCIPA